MIVYKVVFLGIQLAYKRRSNTNSLQLLCTVSLHHLKSTRNLDIYSAQIGFFHSLHHLKYT